MTRNGVETGAGFPSTEEAIAATHAWVDRVVIGLGLCPFAQSVQTKGQVRTVVTHTADPEALLQVLREEMTWLAAADADVTDTTLLVHPRALVRFPEYNDFLDRAEAALEEQDLVGVLQVASFHPQYQFAGTAPDDVGNGTNRSPYPTLHLLREASVTRAVAAFPEPEAIYEKNIRTLEALGAEAFQALQRDILSGLRPATPHPLQPDRKPTPTGS